jgi:HSP20 family protein
MPRSYRLPLTPENAFPHLFLRRSFFKNVEHEGVIHMRHDLDFFKPAWSKNAWPFERVLEDFFAAKPYRDSASELTSFVPTCDLSEEKDHYLIELDIPGARKEDIKVEVNDGYLTISGVRSTEKESKERNQYVSERSFGSFSRSFRLGDKANLERIECRYDNGVLKVAVPKAEKSKARQIEIA